MCNSLLLIPRIPTHEVDDRVKTKNKYLPREWLAYKLEVILGRSQAITWGYYRSGITKWHCSPYFQSLITYAQKVAETTWGSFVSEIIEWLVTSKNNRYAIQHWHHGVTVLPMNEWSGLRTTSCYCAKGDVDLSLNICSRAIPPLGLCRYHAWMNADVGIIGFLLLFRSRRRFPTICHRVTAIEALLVASKRQGLGVDLLLITWIYNCVSTEYGNDWYRMFTC